jgi:fumarylacetoacetase
MSLPKFLFPRQLSTDFTIHNLPYGVFKTSGSASPRIGCAIGDKILDLGILSRKKFIHHSLDSTNLNAFMACEKSVWSDTRAKIKSMLSDSSVDSLSKHPDLLSTAIVEQADATMLMPANIGDYTDFYASEYHAANVGKIFRPNQEPLLPNWKHLPVGYHGRASSIVIDGTPIKRPSGQIKRPDRIDFGPCEKLDFEVELAMFFGGQGNTQGSPIPIEKAEDHIFGVVLMNDWSARDIQVWEYVPLGPFLSKNFATTISPWIVPYEALKPFMVDLPKQSPNPLPYLSRAPTSLLDINIQTDMNGSPISTTNSKYLYWSFGQMVAHHTASGCNLRPGDLLGSGTISSPEKSGFGSLLELTWNGQQPIQTEKGPRTFIQDGDGVRMRGYCEREGVRIGFGTCSGNVFS